ncbi:hypothetical protein OQA88_1744 [Cercophora sp. LCS_1]
MVRLPPAEKLSLALRKNVRDEWDNNKKDLEQQLSEILGQEWTVDINPNAVWPYHNDGYAKESLGSCIKSYVEGAVYYLKYLGGRYDSLIGEVNEIASAHVLTMDVDEESRVSYCGVDVVDGKLRIIFNPTSLGVNINDALSESNLLPALNNAPTDKPLSFSARLGIASDYEPAIAAVRHQFAELLGKQDDEINLNPNFEETFAKLKEAASNKKNDIRDDWQNNLGSFTLKYWEGLAYQMKYQKVGEDDLVQEGFLDAVSSLEFKFRIVDSLEYASYAEVVIKDGILYLQSKATTWGTNIDYAAEKLIDQL